MSETDETITASLFGDAGGEALDPFEIFDVWLEKAKQTEPNDPNAMALATVDADGLPDNRMVLLNGHDRRGFVFYTNFGSAKGEELRRHPRAALLFHWKSLRRQIRIRGDVEVVADAEADAYFAGRARGSQLGAHASAQSRPLASRAELVARTRDLERKFAAAPVPRPDYWSGFRVVPRQIEFWKDGEFRLHDRVLFSREAPDGSWSHMRLNP